MRFGLQKLTLLDFPGRLACTVFARGCNFRCPFCHNASLVRPDAPDTALLEKEDVLAFLKTRTGILDGVCVTGGEPLLQPGIFEFLAEIKDLGYAVKLDTNGSFPDRLKRVFEENLADAAAMDVKHTPEKYARAIGMENAETILPSIRESVEYLKSRPDVSEFRTTVVHGLHTPEDFDLIGQWLAGAEHYFLQKYTDSGDVLNSRGLSAPDGAELDECLSRVRKYIPAAALRGAGETRTAEPETDREPAMTENVN